MQKFLPSKIIIIAFMLSCSLLNAAVIQVQSDSAIRTIDRTKMLGTNIAIWNNASTLVDTTAKKMFKDISMSMIRIPGGSLSDQYFWNGNGVRHGNNSPEAVDRSKYRNGKWEIDYSSWAPGFIGFQGYPKDPATAELKTWHGNCDIKELLDFVKSIGSEPLLCVNAGTGNPQDAAELVKWANKTMGYNVKYWEIGQELDGEWESGHFRQDGKKMDGKTYAELFLSFADAMKKVDSTILIGGPGTGVGPNGFIEDLIRTAGDKVDFISYHTYFDVNAVNPYESFQKIKSIKTDAERVRSILKKYQPLRADKIPIGYTEFNISHTDINTANLFSGLWYASAIGELLESQVSFAFQWDAFTQHTENGGGHGYILEEKRTPKAQYWASYIFQKFFADAIVRTSSNDSLLKVYASKVNSNEIYLIVINTDQNKNIKAQIKINGNSDFSTSAKGVRFSNLEYNWNPVEFMPSWNSGPKELEFSLSNDSSVDFPSQSITAIKFKTADKNTEPSLSIIGLQKTIMAEGTVDTLCVMAYGDGGKTAPGVKIGAQVRNSIFKIGKLSERTDKNGCVKFELKAPLSSDSAIIDFTFKSGSGKSVTRSHTIISVKPQMEIIAPDKQPIETEYGVTVNAFYKNGSSKMMFESFPFTCTLEGMLKPEKIPFKSGVASCIVRQSAGVINLQAKIDGLTIVSPVHTVKGYEEIEKETVVIQFDDNADLQHLSGKGEFSIENGKLTVNLKNYSGWVQDELTFIRLNEFKFIKYDKITAITFDLELSSDYDSKNQYSELVLALQGPANWWMPLKKYNLNDLKRGESRKIKLEIDNKEYLDAIHSLTNAVVIFSCHGPISGKLFIDNFGYVVKVEK